MAEYLDSVKIYSISVIETSFQLYFLAKILKKKLWPPAYFLFAVCAVTVNYFLSAGMFIGFIVFVSLLTVCGTWACHGES